MYGIVDATRLGFVRAGSAPGASLPSRTISEPDSAGQKNMKTGNCAKRSALAKASQSGGPRTFCAATLLLGLALFSGQSPAIQIYDVAIQAKSADEVTGACGLVPDDWVTALQASLKQKSIVVKKKEDASYLIYLDHLLFRLPSGCAADVSLEITFTTLVKPPKVDRARMFGRVQVCRRESPFTGVAIESHGQNLQAMIVESLRSFLDQCLNDAKNIELVN